MSAIYDAIIVGGGLAGASTAIHLSRAGLGVLVLERTAGPTHKLCGEFLSVEVQQMLGALGVAGEVAAAGATIISQARIYGRGLEAFESPLPGKALGLSRQRLDEILLHQARAAGATVRREARVTRIDGDLGVGFSVHAGHEIHRGRLVVGAYGKRSTLDRHLDRPFLQKEAPRVAFKTHLAPGHGKASGVEGTIELYGFAGGYIGLSPIEAGLVNACWIAEVAALKTAGGRPERMLDWMAREQPALGRRLDGLEQVSDRFLAISQISFARKSAFERDICMVGDTAGMIAPLCGDGMAMAIESAGIASPLIVDFLEGRCSAVAFRQAYSGAWGRHFGPRLRLGRLAHRAYVRPRLASGSVRLMRSVPSLGRWIIRRTRS